MKEGSKEATIRNAYRAPPPQPPLSPEAEAACRRVETLREAAQRRRCAEVRARARRADRVLLAALVVIAASITASILAEL